MLPEDYLLNGDCEDCDQDPTNCMSLGQCQSEKNLLTCSNCGCCTFVEIDGNIYCIECRQWQGRK